MKKSNLNVNMMVKISLLSILAAIFTTLGINLIFFPSFLKLDIGDIPAIIACLSINIYVGVFVELIKNIIKFILNNDTGGVGEIANFIVGVSYVVPLGIIYKKFNSTKSYFIGSLVATFIMAITGGIFNYFILLPLYAKLFGGMELIINIANTANSSIKDMKTLIILSIIPFNIIKGVFISILSYFLYKSLNMYLETKKIQG